MSSVLQKVTWTSKASVWLWFASRICQDPPCPLRPSPPAPCFLPVSISLPLFQSLLLLPSPGSPQPLPAPFCGGGAEKKAQGRERPRWARPWRRRPAATLTGREWGRAAPGREEGEGRPGWAGRSAVARRRGAGGRCHTVKMSSPPKEKAETRAGHPPAVKAGGMRIVQKHPHNSDAKEEKDKDDQDWETSSPPKPTVFISGVIARGDKDFPPAAAQVAHQKPHPSVEKLPHPQHVKQHIHQPRKWALYQNLSQTAISE